MVLKSDFTECFVVIISVGFFLNLHSSLNVALIILIPQNINVIKINDDCQSHPKSAVTFPQELPHSPNNTQVRRFGNWQIRR